MDLAKEGHNIMLVGVAGTGKSYLLKEIATSLQQEGKKVCVTCSTGIATENFIGFWASTLQVWAGIGKGRLSSTQFQKMIKDGRFSGDAKKRYVTLVQ